MSTVLKAEHLTKEFTSGQRLLRVLDDVSFTIEEGTTTAIVGPSGSGKTTLLGLCAGLDQPSAGSVVLNGVRLENLDEDQRALIRNEHVGFVFQNFQLIPTLTALENIMVPAELRGEKNIRDQSADLLAKVDLADRLDHYPIQLSGGEQQRVALARAFVNRPKILFADEPTGNLDEETSEKVTRLLFELNEATGTTLIIVTHDLELARQTQRIIRLKGGRVVTDELTGIKEKTELRLTS